MSIAAAIRAPGFTDGSAAQPAVSTSAGERSAILRRRRCARQVMRSAQTLSDADAMTFAGAAKSGWPRPQPSVE
jgi:hypothetical protein